MEKQNTSVKKKAMKKQRVLIAVHNTFIFTHIEGTTRSSPVKGEDVAAALGEAVMHALTNSRERRERFRIIDARVTSLHEEKS